MDGRTPFDYRSQHPIVRKGKRVGVRSMSAITGHVAWRHDRSGGL